MSLFVTAVKADLPLIAVQTNDAVNFSKVIQELFPSWSATRIALAPPDHHAFWKQFKGGGIFYCTYDWDTPQYEALYERVVALDHPTTIILLNAKGPFPTCVQDVGVVALPQGAIVKFVNQFAIEENRLQLVPALSGLSYSQMVHCTKMATADGGSFDARSIRRIRRQLFPIVGGLQELETKQDFYSPSTELIVETGVDCSLFLSNEHPMLIPRGYVFDGDPGTGKTSGAKYIANQLGVPLYLLDIGMVLNKYVGESDKNLRLCLEQAETFAPCVLLFDEVEKMMTIEDSSGSVARLLAYLLWWLQEHQSRVLTIMTTNDLAAIPPELYRPGRIDRVITFKGLTEGEVVPFVSKMNDSLPSQYALDDTELGWVVANAKSHGKLDQASLVAQVLNKVKRKLIYTEVSQDE